MTGHTGWWQDFFSGLALDFVRHSRDNEDTLAEADFIQEALGLPLDARLLDVLRYDCACTGTNEGCGEGE